MVIAAVILTAGVARAADTVIDELNLAPSGQWVGVAVGPHAHAASLALRNSRCSVFVDGVEGPEFDQLISYGDAGLFATGKGPDQMREIPVVFSDDGSHCAYFARSGEEYLLIADGKEVAHGKYNAWALAKGRLTYTAGGKHLFYGEADPDGGFRVVMDGHAEPATRQVPQVVVSTDGAHYAYVAYQVNGRDKWLVVDGKRVKYFGEDLKFTSDGGLVAVARGDGGSVLSVDGKPLVESWQILGSPWVSERGNRVACLTCPGQNQPTCLSVDGQLAPETVGATIERLIFSPTGTHYAAICAKPGVGMFVVVDGVRGQVYPKVDAGLNALPGTRPPELRGWTNGRAAEVEWQVDAKSPSVAPAFTAEAAPRLVYLAASSNRFFLVTEGVESDPFPAPFAVNFGAGGKRIGYVAGAPTAPAQTLVIDGVATRIAAAEGRPAANVANFMFSPNGEHYLYTVNGALIVDGVEQAAGIANNGYLQFSPDGKHVLHEGTEVTNPGKRQLFLDGRAVAQGHVRRPLWSPDGKHLYWIATRTSQGPTDLDVETLFLDNRPTPAEFRAHPVFDTVAGNFDVAADGTLTFVSRHGDDLKRWRVTPAADHGLFDK